MAMAEASVPIPAPIDNRRIAGLQVLSARPQIVDPDRSPIILVHGAWHGAWCWRPHFLPFFAGHGYEVSALDLSGHGGSPARKTMRWTRIADYVDDVLSVVETMQRPPVVIGHSMGGLVCQHLMRRTDRMAGIGLLATVPSAGVWRAAARIARTRPRDFLRVNLALSLYPLVDDPVHAGEMFLDADTDADAVAAFAAQLGDESWLGFLDMLLLDLPSRGPATVPMLVVGGESDALFSPRTQHQTAQFYGCDCHIVADAPHDLMLSKHWQGAAGRFLDWLENPA